jgi:hypothetical protein
MNSNRITNLPAPVSLNEPVRLQDALDPIQLSLVESSVVITPFMETLLDDVNAAAARTTLGIVEAVAADDITVTPFGSITATNVQDALEEVLAEAGGGGGAGGLIIDTDLDPEQTEWSFKLSDGSGGEIEWFRAYSANGRYRFGAPVGIDTAFPEFEFVGDLAQPKLYTRSIFLADPGDTPEVALQNVGGTYGSPTAIGFAYHLGGFIYCLHYDGTATTPQGPITAPTDGDVSGQYPYLGRSGSIAFPTWVIPTQTDRRGGIVFETCPTSTVVSVQRAFIGPKGSIVSLYRAGYEDTGVSYPWDLSDKEHWERSAPGAQNYSNTDELGNFCAIMTDRANGGILTMRKYNDQTNGFDLSFENSGTKWCLDRIVANTRIRAITLSNTDGIIDLCHNVDGSNRAMRLTPVTSQVNWWDFRGSATGTSLSLRALGDDTNISILVEPKGTGKFIVSSASDGAIMRLISTEAGSGAGPSLEFYRNSASPANGDDLGAFMFQGKDSGGNDTNYATLTARIDDATDGSEDGRFQLNTFVAGANGVRLQIGAGLFHQDATGGDKGANTINFGAVYDDNVLLTDYVFDKYLGIKNEYSDRVQERYDSLDESMFDVSTYSAYFKEHQKLYDMPDLNDCIDGAVKEYSLGAMIQKLWQTVELQAIHIAQLNERLNERSN